MTHREIDIASLDQFDRDGNYGAEVEGTKILLIRDGAEVRAISALCPHAGGPLAEGVRHNNRIVCPWHKATFCIRTGALLAPPAVDPLARFDVRVDGQRVIVTFPAAEAKEKPLTTDGRRFVIVGSGAAGAVAAQTLREAGFSGSIVMLDRENRVPYDRTLLSKYFLSGEPGDEKSPLQKQSFYHKHRIERRTAEATRLQVNEHRIECADGSSVDYDAILLATGGTPISPALPGAGLGNVFLLRSRADADAILAHAERSERAVILGASFIGMEVAASLRERGLNVTVVGKEKLPFEKQLGAEVGGALVSLHEQHGVEFRLDSEIAAIEGGPNACGVVLAGGEMIECDLVVIGFGVTPATTYATGLARNEDGGIKVDAYLRAADDVYAAGDIACFPLRGDGAPVRVEHWRVAQQHGRVAALNMAGKSIRYDAVPVFWTIQYLKRVDYVGHATEWDEISVHGDLQKPEFLAYYIKNGVVIAGAGIDRDKDMAALIELFSVRREWSAEALGDSPSSVLAGLR